MKNWIRSFSTASRKNWSQDFNREWKWLCHSEKGNRQIKGYVTGFSEKCEYDLSKVKSILSISEKGMEIETRLIALAAWMKRALWRDNDPVAQDRSADQAERECKGKEHLRLLLSEKEGEEKLAFYRKRTRRHGQDCWKHCLQTGF